MEESPKRDLTTQAGTPSQVYEVEEALSGTTGAAEFKQRSVRGGFATVFGQGYGLALQIVTTVILAHLLSATDYGLQTMVLTLTNFLSLFKDAGLSSATIQRDSLNRDQLSALFWLNVAVGVFLMVLVGAMAPFMVTFYGDPRLRWVTIASATTFLFNSLAVQHHALLDRAMRFTTSTSIGILSGTIGALIAITMAALGFGYWALIAQNISLPIVDAAAVWIAMPFMPGKPRYTTEIRPMLRFGGTVTLNGVVMYFAYNTEKILLGRFWGAAALGLYGRAYQLANMPVQGLMQSVGAVAFPVLSRLQNDVQRLRRTYLTLHSLVVSMTIPIVITCAIFADEIVPILLGKKWIGVSIVLRLLAPTVLVLALINPLSWFLRATGQVERSLRIAFLIAPVVILAVGVGLRHGPPGVAVGYSTAMILLSAPLVAWAKYGTVISTVDYWNCIKRPLAAGALSGTAGWLFKVGFQTLLGPVELLTFGLAVSFALYAYVLLSVLGQSHIYVDLLTQLFKRKPKTAINT